MNDTNDANDTSDREDPIRAAMIAEALALLELIEADTGDDEESAADREQRLRAQALARQLVTEMIAGLQTPSAGSARTPGAPA